MFNCNYIRNSPRRLAAPPRQIVGANVEAHGQQRQHKPELLVRQEAVHDQCKEDRHQQRIAFGEHDAIAQRLAGRKQEGHRGDSQNSGHADGEVPVPVEIRTKNHKCYA